MNIRLISSNRRAVLAILFFFSSFTMIHAQEDTTYQTNLKKRTTSLHVSFEQGAMLGNSSEMSDELVNNSYYNGIDFRYGWTKNDRKNTYNQVYRFPTIGVGWYTSTFHNAEIGKPNALYLFFTLPFKFEESRRWTGSYTGAFGLSYNFNPYDEIDNPVNVFIGSYKNCYMNLAYNLNYHFNPKMVAFGSVGFKHFSNGSMSQPNYGINLFPVALGVRYKFTDQPLQKPDHPLDPFIKHNQYNLMFGFGSKNYVHGDPNYFKMTVGINYLRQINYKYRLGVGLDLFYSAAADLRNQSSQSDLSKSCSVAVVGSWEWVINKVISVPIGLGCYLHHNEENGEKEVYYERVGLRFRMAEHYNLGVTIKAHGGSADYFEWTLAYTFHKDPNKYK